MLAQALLYRPCGEILRPAEILGGAAAVPRLDHQYQCSARFQAGLHIVDGLGALIEGNVLREAAAARDDDVRFLRYIDLIYLVYCAAGLLP